MKEEGFEFKFFSLKELSNITELQNPWQIPVNPHIILVVFDFSTYVSKSCTWIQLSTIFFFLKESKANTRYCIWVSLKYRTKPNRQLDMKEI